VKTWLTHIVFAVILIGSLTANQQASDVLADSGDNEATVIRIARANGLALRKDQPIAGGITTLVFDAPDCTRPVSVTLLSITFEQMPVVQDFPGQHDNNRRYVYLNRIWNRPERLPVFFVWKMQRVLEMFGLTRYVPSRYMLLVDNPSGCRAADAIDWRNVWDRNYLSTIRADIASKN